VYSGFPQLIFLPERKKGHHDCHKNEFKECGPLVYRFKVNIFRPVRCSPVMPFCVLIQIQNTLMNKLVARIFNVYVYFVSVNPNVAN
jgi:hypothetical protein